MRTKQSPMMRAQQFQSFESLRGYQTYLREKERIIVPKKELSIDDCEELNHKIHMIQKGQMIQLIYYDQDAYVKIEGIVHCIDLEYKRRVQIVDKIIPIEDIIHIDGKIFDKMME